MKVSIVVPVYNESGNIQPLAEEAAKLLDRLADLELLFVDDGSSDDTWAKVQACRDTYKFVGGIHYSPNRGQSHAMLVGLRAARGDVMVTIDGDMQNNPADIPALIEAMTDVDAVCGYRAKRRDSWGRRLGSRIGNGVRNLFTQDGIRDTGCSLKAFRRACIEDLPPVEGVHRFMPAYFKLNGRQIKEVPVDHRPRTVGESKYTNMKRLPRTLRDLFGFKWYQSRYLQQLPEARLEILPASTD